MANRAKVFPEPKLVLASRSPRRRALLQQMGIVFEVMAANIDETIYEHESAGEYSRRMATDKARAVGNIVRDGWILGADTVVVRGSQIMGIPGSREEAEEMLRTLSGRSHDVITSFCFFKYEAMNPIVRSVRSEVAFKALSQDEIDGYIHSGEPFDKAGGYAVQGIGAFMVRAIHGSYTNVVGLPVCEVIETMREHNILRRFPEKR